MKKFRKQIFVVAIFGILVAAAIAFSAISVSKSSNEFVDSGYVHIASLENSNKKILFNSGTTYKKKAGNKISFNDIVDENNVIDELNFIHYDDESLSSFVDGIIVDMEDLSQDSTMNHYALSSNTRLQKNGSSYSTSVNSEFNFNDFLWKIDENKYLIVSPTMKLAITSDDVRDIKNYIEVTYIGDNLIQLQTEDNLWTTISNDCHVITDKGYDVNLSDRNISYTDSEGNSYDLLDFSKIVLGSEDNVELAHGDAADMADENNDNVIPKFNITANPGEDGEAGDPGEAGASGSSGRAASKDSSEEGGEGSEIDPDKKVLDYPVFTIKDWNITPTSCSGTIVITDNKSMLVNDENFLNENVDSQDYYGLYLIDQNTGKVIYDTSAGYEKTAKEWQFYDHQDKSFDFTGLTPDHTYVLHANALTMPDTDAAAYVRSYISKSFWTDSLGVYMESASSTVNTINFNIVKRNYVDSKYQIYYKVFDTLKEASSVDYSIPETYDASKWNTYDNTDVWKNEVVEDGETPTYSYWSCYYPNTNYDSEISITLTNNTKKYVRLAYTYDRIITTNDSEFDGISDQILEIATLKSVATVGSPVLTVNHGNWGFEIMPSDITDPDSGIVSYTYEFYSSSQFQNSADNDAYPKLKENQTPIKTIVRYDDNTFSVPIDGVALQSKIPYRVRLIAKFNDNEKVYNITSGFSNTAMVSVSVRPTVSFRAVWGTDNEVQEGSFVKLRDYDALYGYIVINPGTSGSKLMINKSGENKWNHPVVKFSLNGYYEARYIVYDIDDEPSGEGVVDPTTGNVTNYYLKAETLADGRVLIQMPDFVAIKDNEDVANKTVCGLQAGKRYDISVYGDLSDDGVNKSEENVQIGICQVMTPDLEPTMATWTKDRDTDAMQKTNVKFSMANSDGDMYQYNHQKENLQEITFTVYNKEYDTDFDFANAKQADIVAQQTFDKNTTYGKEIIDSLYSEEGLTLTTSMFVPSGDVNAIQTLSDKLSQNPKLTVAISGAYDYTILDEYRQNQKSFVDVPQTDKNYTPENTNDYYYVNEFPIIDSRTTITSIVGINPITGKDWASYTGSIDSNGDLSIQLTAGYGLGSKTATGGSITYYVFDAVDFYAGDLIQGIGEPVEKLGYASYWYDKNNNGEQDDGETYSANAVIKNWLDQEGLEYHVNDDGQSEYSKALNYAVPTNLQGLALGSTTIEFSSTDLTMPTCVFYPMTQSEKGVIGSKDDYGNYYLFFDDGKIIESKGHQFVFAYTINCHTENEKEHYVYPFDSYVWDSTKTALEERETPYSYYATIPTTKIYNGASSSPLNNSDYVLDNTGATYGHDAYMLIPHTTLTNLGIADYPKDSPDCYAVQWNSNFALENSTITMNAVVNDKGKAVVTTPVAGKDYETSSIYIYRRSITNTPRYTKKDSTVNVYKNANADFDRTVRVGLLSEQETTDKYKYSQITFNNNDTVNDIDDTTIAVIPIQRYLNNYTVNNESLHGSTSNEYISGSADGNYIFKSVSDSSSKDIYKELLEVKFFDVVNNSSYEITDGKISDSAAKAYIDWLTVDSVVDSARVQLVGTRDLLQDIVGVRLYFDGKDKTTDQPFTYYIDKYLEKTDEISSQFTDDINMREPIINKSDTTYKDINSPYVLNFKISISEELSKTIKDCGYQIKDFSNMGDIGFSIKLLYRGSNYGFEQIDKVFQNNVNNNDEIKTYSLVAYNRISSVSQTYNNTYHELSDAKSIYWHTENLNSPYVLQTRNTSVMPNYGSFFRIVKQDEDLVVVSTRNWQFGNNSKYLYGYQDVDILTSLNQNILIPTSVEESNFYISVYGEDGNEVTKLDMPKGAPSITYTGVSNTSTQGASVDYSLSSVENDIFFALSMNKPDDTTSSAEFITINKNENDDIVAVKETADKLQTQTIKLSDYNNETYSTYEEWAASAGANQLKKIFVQTEPTTSSIGTFGLLDNKQYYVSAWQYTKITEKDGNPVYGFTRLKMADNTGAKIPNYYAFSTRAFVDSTFTANYLPVSADEHVLSISFRNTSLNKNNNYVIYKLYDENDEYMTILGCFEYDSNQYIYFDLDGDSSDNVYYKTTSTIYDVYDRSNYIMNSKERGYITVPDGTPKINLEYGKTYKIKAFAYSYDELEGPYYREYYVWDYYDPYYDLTLSKGDVSTRPEVTFTVTSNADYISKVLSSSSVYDNAQSYVEFTIPSITRKSCSIKNNKLAPILIWKHYTNAEKTEYELYNVTNLTVNATNNNKTLDKSYGLVDPNSRLVFYFTDKNSTTGAYEYLSWNIDGETVSISDGDVIYCYVYGKQLGTYVSGTSVETSYITGNLTSNEDRVLTAEELLGDRILYTTEDTKPVKVDNSVEEKLSAEFDGSSRNMNANTRAYKNIENIKISVGNVSITVIDSIKQALISLTNYSALPSVTNYTYSVQAKLYREDGTQVKYRDYNIGETTKQVTIDAGNLPDPFPIMLDLSNLYGALDASANEKISQLIINLYFNTSSGGYVTAYAPVDSENIVTSDNIHITYVLNYDIGLEQASKTTKTLQTFLNNMFNTDEGGAANE